jgi:hypothetical protein
MQPSINEKNWRAKLYQLNSDGGWDDLGTGRAQIVKEVGFVDHS